MRLRQTQAGLSLYPLITTPPPAPPPLVPGPFVPVDLSVPLQAKRIQTIYTGWGSPSNIALLTTSPPVNPTDWFPGIYATVADPFGSATVDGGVTPPSLGSMIGQAKVVAQNDTAHIVTGLEVCSYWPKLETTFNNYSPGVTMIQKLYASFTDPTIGINRPGWVGKVMLTCAGGGNGQTGTTNASYYCPTYMIDNATYGTVDGSGGHGGVFYTSTLGPAIRIWNSAVRDRSAALITGINAGLTALGLPTIYRFDPYMEWAPGATLAVAAGATDAKLLAAFTGPSGWPAQVRSSNPRMLVCIRPINSGQGGTFFKDILAGLVPYKVSVSGYDDTNEDRPPDLLGNPSLANPRCVGQLYINYRGKAFTKVGGVQQFNPDGTAQTTNVSGMTDYTVLGTGLDYHCYSNTDETAGAPGSRSQTAAVPPGFTGSARLPDLLRQGQKLNTSHYVFRAQNSYGPDCNCNGNNPVGATNYAYPFGGAVVPYSNMWAYLNSLNPVTTYIRTAYPF